MSRTARTALTAALLALTLATGACSGNTEESSGKSIDELLSDASDELTSTSGVDLDLSTKALPEGVSGIVRAAGVATSAPAFEGDITVSVNGINADVPVIAVDGKVHAVLPFTKDYAVIDPTEYGAPDPAGLLSADDGFPALLHETQDASPGKTVRGGAGNSEVLLSIEGTVPGEAMKSIIPSTAGDSFDVVWQMTSDGELRSANFTGVFYADSDPMTYTVTFSGYGKDAEITAP